MKDSSPEERINELETRLSFQDDTISSLNDALVRQQQRIAQLEKSLELLIERARDNLDDAPEYGEEPPPPHY
jgi:SlyX protein